MQILYRPTGALDFRFNLETKVILHYLGTLEHWAHALHHIHPLPTKHVQENALPGLEKRPRRKHRIREMRKSLDTGG